MCASQNTISERYIEILNLLSASQIVLMSNPTDVTKSKYRLLCAMQSDHIHCFVDVTALTGVHPVEVCTSHHTQ